MKTFKQFLNEASIYADEFSKCIFKKKLKEDEFKSCLTALIGLLDLNSKTKKYFQVNTYNEQYWKGPVNAILKLVPNLKLENLETLAGYKYNKHKDKYGVSFELNDKEVIIDATLD
jgi:hypothetical protein